MADDLVDLKRHLGLAHLSQRPTAFAGEGFDPEAPAAWNQIRVLVVGAGGLGCELLHCLALSGFTELEVIDMDTIDLSNLNRQFLFRHGDIGKPKAEVAAAFITRRFPHVNVVPHFQKIQERSDDWYRSFHIIIMGLDSISARGWLNRKMASLIDYRRDENGEVVVANATPIIDGGTEGFRGSARHIKFGTSACVECSMYLYPPAMGIPMCTLENVPRIPEHCVLYVRQKTWEDLKPFGEQKNDDGKLEPVPVDGDNQEHIVWIMEHAKKRQDQFKIEGDINFQFTQGVVKNVIPAVGFTNAMVAAMCTTEALKLAVGLGAPLSNYTFYDGGANGVASYAQFLEADPQCEVCQKPKHALIPRTATPRQILDAIFSQVKIDGASEGSSALLRLRLRSPGYAGPVTTVLTPATHALFNAVDAEWGTVAVADALLKKDLQEDVDESDAFIEAEITGGVLETRSILCLLFVQAS